MKDLPVSIGGSQLHGLFYSTIVELVLQQNGGRTLTVRNGDLNIIKKVFFDPIMGRNTNMSFNVVLRFEE